MRHKIHILIAQTSVNLQCLVTMTRTRKCSTTHSDSYTDSRWYQHRQHGHRTSVVVNTYYRNTTRYVALLKGHQTDLKEHLQLTTNMMLYYCNELRCLCTKLKYVT